METEENTLSTTVLICLTFFISFVLYYLDFTPVNWSYVSFQCFIACLIPIVVYALIWKEKDNSVLKDPKFRTKIGSFLYIMLKNKPNWVENSIYSVIESITDKNMTEFGGEKLFLEGLIKLLLIMKSSIAQSEEFTSKKTITLGKTVIKNSLKCLNRLISPELFEEELVFEQKLSDYFNLFCYADEKSQKLIFIVKEVACLTLYLTYFSQISKINDFVVWDEVKTIKLLKEAGVILVKEMSGFEEDKVDLYKNYSIILSGHSLGGTLVSLVSKNLSIEVESCVTYGSLPSKFGNEEKENRAEKESYDFIAYEDSLCFITPTVIDKILIVFKELDGVGSRKEQFEEVVSNSVVISEKVFKIWNECRIEETVESNCNESIIVIYEGIIERVNRNEYVDEVVLNSQMLKYHSLLSYKRQLLLIKQEEKREN